MPYKTTEELEKQYEHDTTFKDRVAKLFAVRMLYREALRSETFEPTQELTEALGFTDQGGRLITTAMKEFGCSAESAKFCVFLLLFHHGLLVDVEKTKIARILGSLSQDILSRKIVYPWLFDSVLYDRAFADLAQRPQELSTQQTEDLLSGTPTGVFQVGHFTVGPFGVVQSDERRWFPPRSDLPLYHCEDQMCGDMHVAELAQLDTKHQNIVSGLRTILNTEEGPVSQWRPWITGLTTHPHWYDDFTLANLVWLLGEGFSHNEMMVICEQIISRGKHVVRGKIPESFSGLFAAKSSEIVSKLSKPQLLQVSLISTDKTIAAVIDDLVTDQKLKIPITEVRTLVAAAPAPSWTGAVPECSDLGIRVIGRGAASNPLARLKRLILEIHKSEDAQAQLKWSLRQIPGSTIGDQLEALMCAETPGKLLRNMIVSNISMLKSALSRLRAEHLVLPNTEADETLFVQKLLWKLGFGKTQFESSVAQFWDRLKRFEQVVSSAKQEDESWVSAVRSVGVNLFVSLEELLNNALAFLCWVFLTDPLSDAHIYNSKRGRTLIAKELSGLVETEKGVVTYDPGGKNTMFPLIVGFSALAKRIQRVIDAEKESREAQAAFRSLL
jgi:hypothetical protein